MFAVKTYEQTGVFDPTNPMQKVRTAYTPSGYQSFYFNRQPNTSTLSGLGSSGWEGLSPTIQIGIVGALAAIAGYFGMAKWGDKYVKPQLRKVGINLNGARRARRR
jgi:hypothetical protein